MEKSFYYMRETIISLIIEYAVIFCMAACCQNASGGCKDRCEKLYIAEEFGYMIIDEDKKSIEIFKNVSPDDCHVNIASCRIKDAGDRFFTVTSTQPLSYRDIDIHVKKKYSHSPDSLIVRMRLPALENNSLYISVDPSVGKQETYKFSSKGTVEFHLKKQEFKYNNHVSVIVFPQINPFRQASSWGDCETLSFLDLRMDELLDLNDPELSQIEIDIPDFSTEVFRKWVILDEFVLKKDSDIIWRNIRFVKANIK